MQIQNIIQQAEYKRLQNQVNELKQQLSKAKADYNEMEQSMLTLKKEKFNLEKQLFDLKTEKETEESFLRGQLLGQTNASSCCMAQLINEVFSRQSAACAAIDDSSWQ